MLKLEWKTTAIADLLAIMDYISGDNPDAAQALKDEIEAKTSHIPDAPHLYRVGRVDGGLGSHLFKKRVARKGGEKSGGYRTILAWLQEDKLRPDLLPARSQNWSVRNERDTRYRTRHGERSA
ncbi:type II toxin-antitoxin system RelE/ParE family toxin [Sulfitobacter sp. HI0054]|uniref:type II toxin-antitoxin system RelE/ParE family toxin n=1 Tax=Sulfitobacter sp. HI0054 TaxID=1822238 RepID=UPI0009ED4F10|nr:type II toxin-antitoxin system RelE/ParE family toxin [Sulfitobacter sp. HI0054]